MEHLSGRTSVWARDGRTLEPPRRDARTQPGLGEERLPELVEVGHNRVDGVLEGQIAAANVPLLEGDVDDLDTLGGEVTAAGGPFGVPALEGVHPVEGRAVGALAVGWVSGRITQQQEPRDGSLEIVLAQSHLSRPVDSPPDPCPGKAVCLEVADDGRRVETASRLDGMTILMSQDHALAFGDGGEFLDAADRFRLPRFFR